MIPPFPPSSPNPPNHSDAHPEQPHAASERLAGAEPNIPIEPAPAAPQAVAGELFAHGLLTYLHTDTPAAQLDRVRRVMAAVEAEQGRPAPARPEVMMRFPIRGARGWLAVAAAITVVGAGVFLGFPGESSAQAVVQESIQAMRAPGDRRYEIRLQPRTQDTMPSLPGAIIDTRSPNLLLLRANAPDGHEIVAGRDATGDWAIRLDGTVERQHPEVAWPRWAKVGDETLFVDSVDKLLEELTKSYDLQREGEAKIDGRGDALYRHIVGTKKRVRSPGGDNVEVWIDRSTNVVQRLEMRWNAPPAGRPGNGVPDAGHPGEAPAQPGDDRKPDGGPGANGGPGDGPSDGARPPNPPRRPRGMPPPLDGARPGPGGPDGPGGQGGPGESDGRPRPDGPDMDGGPDGVGQDGNRPPHPRPPHPPPPADRAQRPDGPGPLGPGPGAGDHRGPPRALVMERVDAPTFDAGWFSPDSHVAK